MSRRAVRAWLVAFTVCLSAVSTVLAGSCRFPTMRALDASQMPGLTLVREGETVWPRGDGSWQKVTWQAWRDDTTGVTFEVKWAVFVSSDQARKACQAELQQVSIVFPRGTYSGQPLGDSCWVCPMLEGRFGRLVFCSGNSAASVSGAATDPVSDEPLDYMLLESVARRVLANMPGGR